MGKGYTPGGGDGDGVNPTSGRIPKNDNGVFVDSALNETATEIVSDKTIRADLIAPTGSIAFEDATKLSTNTDTLEIADGIRDEVHEIIVDTYDDSGSQLPRTSVKTALETRTVQTLEDDDSIHFDIIFTEDYNEHLKSVIVKPMASGMGRFELRDNDEFGEILNTETMFTFSPGDIGNEKEVILENRIKLVQGQDIWVCYDGPSVKGHDYVSDPTWGTQFVPFLKIKVWPYVNKYLALDEDISCKITKSADQEFGSGDYPVFITWDQEEYDTDNMFDTGISDTVINIKTAGKYLVVLQASWQSNNTGQRVFILLKNGIQVGKTQYTSVSSGDHTFSWMGKLEIGNTLSMIAFQTNNSGDLDLLSSGTYLAVQKFN